MKKLILLSIAFSVFSEILSAQNFLSPAWKISFSDTSSANPSRINADLWKPVNLLLSWERQGYFGRDGKCCLANKFTVPETYKNSDFTLTLSMQCNVDRIYINGRYIGGKLPNRFWSDRDARTIYQVPKGVLFTGSENTITLFASDLSYTGGRSHNLCWLKPSESNDDSRLKISFAVADHLFSASDQSASVRLDYKAQKKGTIELFVISDFHDTLVHKAFPANAGEGSLSFQFANEISKPGFYECTAILEDIGFAGDAGWFALSPEAIVCSAQPVPGFRKYWEDALEELKHVKPEFRITRVDSLCTANRDGYIAEMKSMGGLTIRGYYFVPRTPGRHAAILHVPGYGYGFDQGKPFLNNTEDVIELAICVRGHGISADVFNPGFDIPGIWGYQLCSEKENAYRSIYMDCVRAVDFLTSRTEVDTNNIFVTGGSQGGGLTLATAGLCSDRIKACAFFDPFMTDTRDQLKIRTICEKEIRGYLKYYHDACTFEEAMTIQDLIDTRGFADWIKCPVYFATALFDDDCPSHMGFSAYNRIKSPKQFKIYPEDSHLAESGIYNDLRKYLIGLLK
jgi:cephalosporin-C deacetylase